MAKILPNLITIFVIVKNILKKYWGYDSFRAKQQEIITSALEGRDVLGILPTGGGKSLCFQLPTMMRDGLSIVVTPLVSLIKDQVANLRSRGIKALAVHSGMTSREIDIALDNAAYGDYKFLYLSPERLRTELFRNRVQKMNVAFLVVDEAHCISQWGYDFRPDYLLIAKVRELLPDVPVIALTATATPEVAADIQKKLAFGAPNVQCSGFARPNLAYRVIQTENKLGALQKICADNPGTGIVYVRERKTTKEIAGFLRSCGESAEFYHAGLGFQERSAIQERWKSSNTRIIVSTNAFGMGIDKPDVRFVCHYDMPEALESYYQEAGRAGRDGKSSVAVLLWDRTDVKRMDGIQRTTFPGLDYIADVYQKVFRFYSIAYGDGAGTRRKFSLVDFLKQYGLNASSAYNALKYIEMCGYWTVTDELDNPTRLMFTVGRDDLYNIQLRDYNIDTFVKALMRIYPGLFSQMVAIDEEYLARQMMIPVQTVKHHLLTLSRQRVLTYVPQNRSPLICFENERLTPDNLFLDPSLYEHRQKVFRRRLDAMYSYISDDSEICRSKRLSAYFGENDADDCGVCDMCK